MGNWPARAQLNIDATRLVELTDSVAAPNVVDEALIERLRLDAVELVESYCTDYVTPFVNPPPNVVEWAVMVWRYKVFSHRSEMKIPETVVDDFRAAMKSLERVAAKTLPLKAPQLPSSNPPSSTAGGLVENIERRFGRNRDGLG